MDQMRAAETNLPQILAITASFQALSLILVACRVYTRFCLVQTFGKDDALIIVGALCVLGGGMGTTIIAGYYGLGRHEDTLLADDYKMYQELVWFQALFVSTIGMAAIKVSVGFSLLRMSTYRRFRLVIWALIVFTGCYSILGLLTVVLYCQPISAVWDPEIHAKCFPRWLLIYSGYFNTGANIFTDICFATAPIPLIWALNLNRRIRVYLIIIFNLGYFAVGMAVMKGIYQTGFWQDPDRTFLEANVSLMAASAPALKPLLDIWFRLPSDSGKGGELPAANACPYKQHELPAAEACPYKQRDLPAAEACPYKQRDLPAADACPYKQRDLPAANECPYKQPARSASTTNNNNNNNKDRKVDAGCGLPGPWNHHYDELRGGGRAHQVRNDYVDDRNSSQEAIVQHTRDSLMIMKTMEYTVLRN